MNCDSCRHYSWYYDRCRKWGCKVDAGEVHNCFEAYDTPILDAMVEFKERDEVDWKTN